MINSQKFGSLHLGRLFHADRCPLRLAHRRMTLDDLLRWYGRSRRSSWAHPKAIAAFELRVYLAAVFRRSRWILFGSPGHYLARRAVLVPCDKLEIKGQQQANQWLGTTSILLLRTERGRPRRRRVAPRPASPVKSCPASSARLMGLDSLASVASYLLTALLLLRSS